MGNVKLACAVLEQCQDHRIYFYLPRIVKGLNNSKKPFPHANSSVVSRHLGLAAQRPQPSCPGEAQYTIQLIEW